MSKRDAIIITQTQEDLEHVKAAYPSMTFVDITDLIDLTKYPTLTRSGIGAELFKLMPAETHQRVSVILPLGEGEVDEVWRIRTLVHPILSILASSFDSVVAVTPESALIYKEYAKVNFSN
jgi:hypothetical protein